MSIFSVSAETQNHKKTKIKNYDDGEVVGVYVYLISVVCWQQPPKKIFFPTLTTVQSQSEGIPILPMISSLPVMPPNNSIMAVTCIISVGLFSMILEIIRPSVNSVKLSRQDWKIRDHYALPVEQGQRIIILMMMVLLT
jgi:hypothetical protein